MLTTLQTHLTGWGRIIYLLTGLLLATRPAQSQVINTVAGNVTAVSRGDGGPATSARLSFPTSVAVDAAGNIYISDSDYRSIRKVNTNGIITTIAGNGNDRNDGDGGPAINAAIYAGSTLLSIALDDRGNVYIGAVNVVRKVSPDGIITTVAGNNVSGYSGDGGPATQASLNGVSDVVVDKQGNLFIADRFNGRVRKVDNNGVIMTVVGSGNQGNGGDGGPATSALVTPAGLAIDNKGNLFISDLTRSRIRKVDTNGIITTVAGDPNKISGIFGGDGGPATQAQLSNPRGLAVDNQGNLYISDFGNARVRQVNTNGIINTIAGGGMGSIFSDGIPATQAIVSPIDVALDSQERLYIADTYGTDTYPSRIRRIDLNNLPPTVVDAGISSPRSATVGVPFSLNTASAFTDPEGRSLTYSSSSLPAGLSLNPSTGLIAGTPANPGTVGITVVATDDGGNTANIGFFLNIERNPNINQPPQIVGNGLTSPLSASVGVGVSITTAYAFRDPEGRPLRYISSPLPAGLSLNASTGLISGTPAYPGTAGITVGATDDAGNTVYSGFFLNIQSGVVVVGSGISSPQSATVGAAISIPTAYAFSDPSGRPLRYSSSPLPAGLSLNPNTGVISGTPVYPGTAGITVVATSETNVTVYSGFFLNIRLDPSINVAPRVVGNGISSPQSGTVGVAFSTPTAYAFSDPEGRALTYSSSSLPDGLSINPSTGVITGTPTRAYTFGVTVGATDDGGSTTYSGFFVTIVNPGGGRLGQDAEAGQGLQVQVLGNPLHGDALRALITGATGQRLYVELLDVSSRPIRSQMYESAESRQLVEWNLNTSGSGVYLLQAVSGNQRYNVKVVKP